MISRIVQRIGLFLGAWFVFLPVLAFAQNFIALQLPGEDAEYRGGGTIEFRDGSSKTFFDQRNASLIPISDHTPEDIQEIIAGGKTYTKRPWKTERKEHGRQFTYTLIQLNAEGLVPENDGGRVPARPEPTGTTLGVGVGASRPAPAVQSRLPKRKHVGEGGGSGPRWGVLAVLALAAAAGWKKAAPFLRRAGVRNGTWASRSTSAEDWRGLYDIVSVGKSGGFGDTYTVKEKAWWKWQPEVLKVLKGNWTQGTWSGDRIWVEQMKHECDHLDYLEGRGYRHAPRILMRGGLLNPTKQGNEAWFTMTMVRGVSLKKALRTIGKRGARDRLKMVKALTKALAELHRYGIAHRDLTPENIFVQDTIRGVHVDLIDFGSAKRQTATQTIGVTFPPGIAFVGKTSYCAPEHLRNINQAGIPSDDYALGVLSCQILLGDNPFKSGSSREEALAHHLQVDRWALANRLCREGGVKAEVAMYLAGSLLNPEEGGRGTAAGFLQLLKGSYPFA